MSAIYLLNSVQAGFLDLGLQKQDVTIPPIIQMPASWNKPRTRVRVKYIGTFQLPVPGDVFIRKFWIGKTEITKCATQAIRPNEGRTFNDEHDIILYGDNLHAIYSRHHTGIVSSGSFTAGSGNSATTQAFSGAYPATAELSGVDAPLIIDGDWARISWSFFGITQDQAAKIAWSIREVTVEQIEV